jgi:hypothetical protein
MITRSYGSSPSQAREGRDLLRTCSEVAVTQFACPLVVSTGDTQRPTNSRDSMPTNGQSLQRGYMHTVKSRQLREALAGTKRRTAVNRRGALQPYSSLMARIHDEDGSFLGGPVRPSFLDEASSSLNLPGRLQPSRPFLKGANNFGADDADGHEALNRLRPLSETLYTLPPIHTDHIAHAMNSASCNTDHCMEVPQCTERVLAKW